MNTKEFIQSLRKLIREEVRSAVRDELHSVLNESTKPKEVKKQIVSTPKQVNKLSFNTGNSILDEVLAETVVPRGFGGESGPMVSDYDNIGYSSNADTGLSSMMSDDELPQTSMYNDPTMAFVKDYSAVLKKAEQIRK